MRPRRLTISLTKSWHQKLAMTMTLIFGLVCGAVIAGGILSISVIPTMEAIEVNHQFRMKYAAYRFLATNNVPRAQAALIAQMSSDVCGIAHDLETRTLLPFAKRTMIAQLQSIRETLDYHGLDLGTVEPSTDGARITARRAQAVLTKYTVARVHQSTEPDDVANGSQPIRSETNRTSSAAGSR